MSLRTALLSAATLAAAALASPAAHATPDYTFSSSGTFSNDSGVTGVLSNGTATTGSASKIEWGGTFGGGTYDNNGSTMTAGAITNQSGSFSTITPTVIGSLVWTNASGENTTTKVMSSYTLTLTFTNPTPGGAVSDTFNLTVTNTANVVQLCFIGCINISSPVDDTGTVSAQSPSIAIDGLLISNFTFSETGSGTYNSQTGVWSNPENGISTLNISANISQIPVAAVPEPSSVLLMGSGLLGLALVFGRRTKRLSAQT